MASVDGARSVQGASDEVYLHVCGPCNYGSADREATRFCRNCEEYLCRNCSDSHKGHKNFRTHKIVSLEELSNKARTEKGTSCSIICDCNQNLEISIYCEDHDDAICQACKSVKHRNCKTVPISEKSTPFAETKLDSVAQKAKSLKDEIDKYLNERHVELNKLASMKEKCKTDIQSFRKELSTFFELLEQDLLKELDKRESMERKEIERHVSTFSSTSQMLQTDGVLVEKAKKSSNEDMFVADVKISPRLKDYERLVQDIRKEMKSPTITFNRKEELNDIQTKINNLGTLTVDHIQTYKDKGKMFTDLTVVNSSQIDIKIAKDQRTSSITGCTFMHDGQIILCDFQNYRVKLLSKSYSIKKSLALHSWPWDLSVVDKTSVIISLPYRKQLQYIQVVPTLKTGRTIQLDEKCWGIQVVGEHIFATSGPGEAEIRVLNLDGGLNRKVGVNQDGSFMFKEPNYLTISATTGRIYVSDWSTCTVTCLLSDGKIIYQYRLDPDLSGPGGVCVDSDDNIIVCDKKSNNVEILTANGKRHGTILTSNIDIKSPSSVAWRHTDNTLIIGCYEGNKLFVCQLA